MIILGIETSCDETAAAVLEKQGDRITILSNVIASSASLQAKYGGIIPEQAAREQIKSIIPVIEEALKQAFPKLSPLRFPLYASKIDAIAVTYGPGLIGSLLVGVETAKTLSLVWDKPLIPVNHLLGHFWANWISPSVIPKRSEESQDSKSRDPSRYALPSGAIVQDDNFEAPKFPCIGLLVSGGHTELVLFKSEQDWEYLGGTRDDAAGECFDKCARLLGLPYPGGPEIARRAQNGDPSIFKLPSPMINSKDFDFSFSGLKTAVANVIPVILSEAKNLKIKPSDPSRYALPSRAIVRDDKLADLAASIEQAIVDVLVEKTIRAAQKYRVEHIMIAGGVAANQQLVNRLQVTVNSFNPKITLHVPPPNLCTDNGAMIASRGFFEKAIDPLKLQAEPGLGLD